MNSIGLSSEPASVSAYVSGLLDPASSEQTAVVTAPSDRLLAGARLVLEIDLLKLNGIAPWPPVQAESQPQDPSGMPSKKSTSPVSSEYSAPTITRPSS